MMGANSRRRGDVNNNGNFNNGGRNNNNRNALGGNINNVRSIFEGRPSLLGSMSPFGGILGEFAGWRPNGVLRWGLGDNVIEGGLGGGVGGGARNNNGGRGNRRM